MRARYRKQNRSARHIATLAAVLALFAPATVTTVFAEPAGAMPPPMNCVDDPYGDGCPHHDSGSGDEGDPGQLPADWVADQFHYDGTLYFGWDDYVRNDGADPTNEAAGLLARDLGYRFCYALKNFVRCTDE